MHGLKLYVISKLRAGFRLASTAPRKATLAIVILLAAGDKGTQAKDIKIALGLAKQIKE
jgi:putative component of toxin-antitoxin plasmid stabilization module